MTDSASAPMKIWMYLDRRMISQGEAGRRGFNRAGPACTVPLDDQVNVGHRQQDHLIHIRPTR
jgi:hypothetical protein